MTESIKKKYKPCCNTSCLLGHCETRDNGGCYCLCRLKDRESNLERVLSGEMFRRNRILIYEPGRTPIPLQGDEKEQIEKALEETRLIIKGYENNES